jgi:PAS domain S-box-containing protein
MNNSSKQSKTANLRQKAETLLRINAAEKGLPLSEIETLKLIHELEVHQIELEMQYDELMLSSSAVQEAAEKYSELYDFAPSVFLTLSKEGEIIELNLSGAEMLGKERSRLKNIRFGFLLSNDTKPIFNLFLEKVFISKAKESCEVILSVNNNLPMHIQLTGIAVKNGEQCLLTVTEITDRKQVEQELIIVNKELVFQNKEKENRTAELIIANTKLAFQITVHKQTEEALKESEERFRTIFENSTIGIYRTTPEGQFLLANPTLLKLLGYSSFEELAVRNLAEEGFEPSYERTHFMDLMSKEGEVKELESAWTNTNGTTLFVCESARAIKDKEGKIIYYDGIVEDITLRKKAEQELIIVNKELFFQNEEKEKRSAELTRSKQILDETGRLAKVGGWEIDLKKNVLTWSDVVYQIHEVEPDYQPTIESAINFYSPEAIPVISEAVSLAIKEGKSFDIDLQLITAKQNRIWVRAIGQAYRVNGEIVKIGGVFQNINESKRVEQELIVAKEKAEESDRLKTAFLNNISHEIRTPFNGILGFLSLMQDHDLLDDEREEYINIINQSADRLMNTINDIIEVSHIQSGQVKLAVQNTNIKQLTDKLIYKFDAFAKNKGLEFSITNDLPNNITSISTDGIKLKTILTNLIGNALKFTRIGSVELCLKKKNDILEFSVKDTGIGISENRQQIIFERFMQSNVSNTREFEGLGLGLTIVKEYVKMLGGMLWMESEEGKGTTFNFTIPYIDDTEK